MHELWIIKTAVYNLCPCQLTIWARLYKHGTVKIFLQITIAVKVSHLKVLPYMVISIGLFCRFVCMAVATLSVPCHGVDWMCYQHHCVAMSILLTVWGLDNSTIYSCCIAISKELLRLKIVTKHLANYCSYTGLMA